MSLTRPVVPGAHVAANSRAGAPARHQARLHNEIQHTAIKIILKRTVTMTRLYILRLLTLCWAIAGMATTDTPTGTLVQEVAFVLMGQRIDRTRLGDTAEAAFEFIDLLAA